MKTTTDLFSGKRFRYTGTCLYRLDDGTEWIVPERVTSRTCEWLHPGRVPPVLLAKLNNGRTWGRREPTYDELVRLAEGVGFFAVFSKCA